MSPSSGPSAVTLRPAVLDEAGVVADLYWRVRSDNPATIPAMIHSHHEVQGWAREHLLPSYDVWVAELDGALLGFIALGRPDWIEHLYVRADVAGQGLGTRLLELAKRELAGPIQLWTFQSNIGARRFYERHGFVAVEWTDGDNEEGAPDVLYLFTPS